MAKGEGAEVLNAYKGPEVEHDDLMDEIQARSADEYARASDAAESGAKLKEFLEETGLNSQAFSWLKAIVKKLPKKDGQAKAMDVIRSLKLGLPMIEAHVGGQGTGEMDLPAPEVRPDTSEPAEPISEAEAEELATQMADDDDNIEHVDFEKEPVAG